MKSERCEREDELLDALRRGFAGTELEEHAASCASCSELRLVAGALLDDRADAVASAEVPTAGAMLWRMRVRARRDAESRARRSLLLGHAATLAVAIALAAIFFGPTLATAASQLFHHPPAALHTPLLVVIATSLLLAPLAGWAVVRGK